MALGEMSMQLKVSVAGSKTPTQSALNGAKMTRPSWLIAAPRNFLFELGLSSSSNRNLPLLMTAEEMDDALCEYGQHCFDVFGGRGKWRLNMAVYGIEHYVPAFQEKLVMARRSLKGWSNLRPPKAHPPITYGLACVVAAELSRMGHPGAAVGVLLRAARRSAWLREHLGKWLPAVRDIPEIYPRQVAAGGARAQSERSAAVLGVSACACHGRMRVPRRVHSDGRARLACPRRRAWLA